MLPSLAHDSAPALELWAGFECTLNRVGDVRHDQLARTGHDDRPDDIDRLAALGVRTVRYPVLWERYDGLAPNAAAWRRVDGCMERLRRAGIDPIVGLVHHGSGPMDTNLLDDVFPHRLAAFARQVAARYPWVTRFTPVNEPLTTARFSALYGIWYPHLRDDRAFVTALLTQVAAVRLAMTAIREITPGAQLVQTEDLGHTHATDALADQAAFENARRWLTFDLLTGAVTPRHPLWHYLHDAGLTVDRLQRAVGDGCPPDIVGVNHYVTSERWLDHRLEHYPASTHGGNGRQRYADVEAVRASVRGLAGPAALLVETWQRYGLPIAVTEAHLGCTREQQMRWLYEIWQGAQTARASGADVRAVAAWAALGAFDWASLVTREANAYESGLFDVRAPAPRPTGVAALVRDLATMGDSRHPVLAEPGWWRRPMRLSYFADGSSAADEREAANAARPILITGARGTLAVATARRCAQRGLAHVALDRAALDVTDHAAIAHALDVHRPWAVVNTAGYVRVDDAEWDAAACRGINTDGAASLARACHARGIAFVTLSSDLVFDGETTRPYVEHDAVAPCNVYGRSKADAERLVLEHMPEALVVRAAWFFGPWDEYNFLYRALRAAQQGVPIDLPSDQLVSPTYVPHLVDALLDLLIDGERGIWHLANDGAGSVADVARHAVREAGFDPELVRGRPSAAMGYRACRPRQSALASDRGWIMPTLDDGIRAFVAEWRTRAPASGPPLTSSPSRLIPA